MREVGGLLLCIPLRDFRNDKFVRPMVRPLKCSVKYYVQ